MISEGRVLLVANPAAQIGHGADAARVALALLQEKLGQERVDLALTEHKGHASELAWHADSAYGTIVGLGGDGVMHEIANGLMRREPEDRPAFGVIPVGSGNDYAASISMSSKLEVAVGQLIEYPTLATDVGCCNGQYYLETLSFGVDAAIALGTEQRRVETGHTGTRLYLEEGIDKMLHHRDSHAFHMDLDEGCRVVYRGRQIASESERLASLEGSSLLLAVQVGKTYGGGFCITPAARLDDGVLDVCIAHPPLSAARATYIFLRAKNGGHTKYKAIEFLRARGLHIEFDAPLPAQIDGERIEGTTFDVSVFPRALRVIRKA